MKRAIDGLLLALGFILVITGAWWMWTGWDVVQVERGWASVIAGSVMLSGGFVVVAISWAVARLRYAGPAAAVDAPALAAPPPPTPVTVPVIAAGVAATAFAASRGFEKAEPADVADEDYDDEDEPLEPEAPAAPVEAEPRRPSIDDLMRRNLTPPAAEEPAPSRFEPLFPNVVHETRELAEERHVDEPVERDDLDDEGLQAGEGLTPAPPAGPIFPPRREPEAPSPAPAPAPAPQVETKPEPMDEEEGDWFDQAERSLDRALGRAVREPEAEAGAAHEPPSPKAPPAVTGRYSSGDTNYIMFDDGSIEAQTPDGVMRFASLVDLRRFVEQRK